MNKEDFERFISPFTPETKMIFENGSDVRVKYMIDDEGEGYIVLLEGLSSIMKGRLFKSS